MADQEAALAELLGELGGEGGAGEDGVEASEAGALSRGLGPLDLTTDADDGLSGLDVELIRYADHDGEAPPYRHTALPLTGPAAFAGFVRTRCGVFVVATGYPRRESRHDSRGGQVS